MDRSSPLRILSTFALAAVVASCSELPAPTEVDDGLLVSAEAKKDKKAAPGNVVDAANNLLALRGAEYQVAYAEYYTVAESGEMGTVIFASDRGNKQLAFDYIPDDPRRGGLDGDPNTIDFVIDVVDGSTSSGLDAAETTTAVTQAMNTWDAQSCSELGASVTPVNLDLGLVQAILGFGGGPTTSDIVHGGWLPGGFFDLLAPGGSTFILGVTFTLTFDTGDLDGDGQPDLAAREIYYNDAFSWTTDGTGVDVETVALHEAGHGLSQAHFGKIFRTPSNGKLHFSPRAVMNAAYSGPQRTLAGTDNGGHCSNWGSWPND